MPGPAGAYFAHCCTAFIQGEETMSHIWRNFRTVRVAIILAVLGGFSGGCFFEDHDHHHHDHDWHESHEHFEH
jgi:hypothetical protein